MQKIINRILEENFNYEKGSVEFSCEKLELFLKKGQLYEGSFHIYASSGVFAEGEVFSSDWRMECLTREFSGFDAEIFFRFHGETLEEGDVIKGCFYMISNQGEYYLPFVVSVEYSGLETSMGVIRNLFQFADLAKNSWQEAVKLFCSPGFSCVLSGEDAKYAEDYRALAVGRGRGQSLSTEQSQNRSVEQGNFMKQDRSVKQGRSMEAGHSMKQGRIMEQNRIESGYCREAGHAVEEFLLQTGKKQRVEFWVEQKQILVETDAADFTRGTMERELYIVRNDWGFTRLAVEYTGDFLSVEKEILTEEDFVGNRCRLPIYIDAGMCRAGRHYGRIRIRYSYGMMVIPVEVRAGAEKFSDERKRSKKRYMADLMKLYQAFRLRKIGTSVWLKETSRLVEGMAAMDENDMAVRLFQAQLLITEGRVNEAGWILDYVSDVFGKNQPEDVLQAYYLYLTTLIHGDAAYIGQAAGRVERIYRRDISNWRSAWLMLYLSEEYQNSDREKWQLLEQLFETGCTSPVIYIEALTLLNNNPALLRRLGEFEQQTIYYGIRKEFLKPEAAKQTVYLAGREKEYSKVLLKILEALYRGMEEGRFWSRTQTGKDGAFTEEALFFNNSLPADGEILMEEASYTAQTPSMEEAYFTGEELSVEKKLLLQGICTLLMKGGKIGGRYFKWYKEGVDARLRIAGLYEAYMMSMEAGDGRPTEEAHSMEEGYSIGKNPSTEGGYSFIGTDRFTDMTIEIPKTVLMYFSYQSHLDYVHTAYLYDYVLQNRESLGELCQTYLPQMELFVMEQIRKGHINSHLANLYQKLLRPEMMDEQLSISFSRLLFAHLIRVENSGLRKVYVYQPGNLKPAEYVLTEGCTWAALYGNRYTIVFEDAEGNRFLKSVEYTIEKLMIPGKFLRWFVNMDTKNQELDFYMCDSECIYKGVFREGIERELRAAASENVDRRFKSELSMRILQYYYDKENPWALDKYLDSLAGQEFTAKQRGEIIRLMVLRGKYNLAERWLEVYGPYAVEAETMAQLLDVLIEQSHMKESPVLTAAAEYVFRKGKCSSTTAAYLAAYYRGMVRNLRHIWKAARSFELDCRELSERILVQMLYSGAFVGEKMEIFRHYVSQGARFEVKAAFLAQCAYEYFVRDRVTEKEVFYEIRQMYLCGEPVQKICRLALLKYDADSMQEPEEGGEAMREAFLTELAAEGVRLEFFKKFKECPVLQQELADKTIVEYRTSPKAKVHIHYVIPGEDGEEAGYASECMKEAYKGVYFKEFVLFFDECLQYYITEELNGEEQLTESGTLRKSEDDGSGEGSRYGKINDIVVRKTHQEYDSMDQLLMEYYKKEFMNSRLFELK